MKRVIIFLFIFFAISCERNNTSTNEILPQTQFPTYAIEETTPQRVKDLTQIVFALEKYKQDFDQYPISSNNGKNFDGLFGMEDPKDVNWIKGLTPKYLEKLPADPRDLKKLQGQYLYKSNGANYMLLASSPDDCEQIKENYKNLFQSKRDCWAYGYWTEGASNW